LTVNSVLGLGGEDGVSTVTKLQLSSGRLQIATWLILMKAVWVCPPNRTKFRCWVDTAGPLETEGFNPVREKPASGIGGELL
jgi:hypothetical protein